MHSAASVPKRVQEAGTMKNFGQHLAWMLLSFVLVENVLGNGWPAIFDPYRPVTLYLDMAPEDWDRVRFDQPQQSESWIPEVAEAWMHGEGETPIRVAVRRKGESDIALPSDSDPRKVSLKIDINEYVDGQTWHDLRKLSLENGSEDPLAEGFSWLIHRQAEPFYTYQAALSGWVRLYINGELTGVYTSAEQRDATFLRNHDLYSPTCTWLYKIDGSPTLEVGVSDSPAFLNLQFPPFNSGPGGPPGGDGGTSPDFDAYLPQWINMRGMLTMAACHAFTENTDSLFTHDGKNSFCVDFDPPYPRTRRYYPWDLDTGMKDAGMSIYGSTTYQTTILDHPWFGRVYEHIFRELLDGPLSGESLTEQLDRMEAGLTEAFTADPYVYEGGPAEAFSSLRNWVVTRNTNIRSQFRHAFVPRPILGHPGGEVMAGYELTLGALEGTVYYTVDGTDPRAPGGVPSASAIMYGVPVLIEAPLRLVARTLVGEDWSGLPAEASYTIAAHGNALRVTEIMYNPLDTDLGDLVDNDAYEFIEFFNSGAVELDLSSCFCDGITFTFPVGFVVPPGGHVVLVRDPAGFSARYPGVPYDGVYLGKLSNGGEKIRVQRADGATILSVEYDDDPPWDLGPDGMGYSLVNMDIGGNPDHAANWRASANLFGSPGAADPAPPYSPGVVFNEVLSHTDPPFEDAVELQNPTGAPIGIGGWYLSDAARDGAGNLSSALLKKYRIPAGTEIPAGGYAAFYEQQFNGPDADSPFALSEFGERVYLSAADAFGNLLGHVVALEFPAMERNASFGRVLTSIGPDHAPLSAQTFGVDEPAGVVAFRAGTGAPNAPARVGPVVISEIMYHPPSNLTEYVELHNISAVAVDISAWKLHGAGGFVFPPATQLPAGGIVLVVDTNRISVADFRVARDVPAECLVFGVGMTLDNNGERCTLFKPNTDSDPTAPPWPMESVRYNDKAPWPTEADGGGPSLERYDLFAYANEPLNWRTSRTGGSPGRPNRFDEGLAVITGSRWTYQAPSASLGVAWRDPEYADTVWPDGHAPLGYGESDIVTVVPYGPDPGAKYVTTYFRKAFTFPENPAAVQTLTFEVRYDDGFVAYLNGVEIARRSMPAGEPAYATFAEEHESGPFEAIALGGDAVDLLRQGSNLLAAEVHQADPASQDLFWDARLTYLTAETSAAEPPEATPDGGLFIGSVTVSVASATADAEIRYTLDGATPDETSPRYDAPLTLTYSAVLKARAYALDHAPSGVSAFAFDRIEYDGDADGLPDAWEIQYFGDTAAMGAADDPDGDGSSNADEYVAGTDPLNASDAPRLAIAIETGTAVVQFMTITTDAEDLAYGGLQRYYTLESSLALSGPGAVWSVEPEMDSMLGNDAVWAYPVPMESSPGCFRLVIGLGP
jgi:spore coat protein CotH